MIQIEENSTLGIAGGSYPEIGFAFNPLPLTIITDNPSEIKLTVAGQNITLVRNTFAGKDGNKAVFDLSGVARSLFDRDEFSLVRKKTYLLLTRKVNIRTIDEELYKPLNIELKIGENTFLNTSIPIIWGALQIGETYSQNKTLTAFRGYPFSFSLFLAEDMTTIRTRYNSENFGDYTELSAGKYNLNIDRAAPNSVLVNSVDYVVDQGESYSPFDYTFDYTFYSFSVDSIKIHIDVEDVCENDKAFYLRWINQHGEWNYYLFHQKSEQEQTSDHSIKFDQYFSSIHFDQNGYHPGTGGSIGKTVKKTIGLYASLVNSDTFDFLLQLTQSPVVDLFMGYEDDVVRTEKWMNVSTQAGTFAKSSDHLQDFEFNLILPDTFTQNL